MTEFGRIVRIEAGQPDAVGQSLEGARIVFDVQYTSDKKANEGTISVYNPSKSFIGEAQKKGAIIRLFAGYGVPRLIFSGNPIPRVGVDSDRQGGDGVTKIKALDAGTKIQSSYLDLAFGPNTAATTVIAQVAAAADLALAPLPDELSSVVFASSLVLSGRVDDAIERVADLIGGDGYIRDGAIYILPEGSTTQEPIRLFSSANGTLLKLKRLKDRQIEAVCLLDGSVRPGRMVQIQHRDFTGQLKLRTVKFTGDSGWAPQFYVTITGREITP